MLKKLKETLDLPYIWKIQTSSDKRHNVWNFLKSTLNEINTVKTIYKHSKMKTQRENRVKNCE